MRRPSPSLGRSGLSVAVVFAVAIPACAGAPAGGGASGPATGHGEAVEVSVGAAQLAEGVTAMERVCAADLPERCDGLDDDCDGRIDEGATECPAEARTLELTLAFDGPAAIALIVDAPTDVTSGDAPSSCDATGLVVLRRGAGSLAPGRYSVGVRRAAGCEGAAEGPTTVSLSGSADGAAIGTFNVPVPPEAGAEVPMIAFEVERAEPDAE